jgi:ribosomal protein L11 methyltransferase
VENSQRNQCQHIKALLGNANLLGEEQFDLILANINKNVLLADMKQYCEVLVSGGQIIFSGFFESDNETLINCAKNLNLALLEKTQDEGWSCLSFRKIS